MLDSILADRDMVVDIVKNGTMLIVARLLSGSSLNNNMWEISTLYILIGFAVYHIAIKRIVPNHLIHNSALKNAARTIFRLGTMFIVAKILSREKMSKEWIKSVLYVIVGYVVFDLVIKRIVPIKDITNTQINYLVTDILLMITVALVSRLLEQKSLYDKSWLLSVLFTIIGFGVYDIGVSNFI